MSLYLFAVICFFPSGASAFESVFENDPDIVLNSQDLNSTPIPFAQVD